MNKVSGNVYVETGFRGCNVGFVITSRGIVIIDTPMRPTEAVKWRNNVSESGEIRYIINTEPHPDHVSGNFFFPGFIIAHSETRNALSGVTADKVREQTKRIDPQGLALMEGYKVRLPDITFTDKLTLYFGDQIFELIYLPGHTNGVIGVYIPKERVVFASDCIFYKRKSYLNDAVPHLWIESIKKLSNLDVDIIVPGHGDRACGKEYLQEQTNIIQEWVERVKIAIHQGLGEAEAIAKISCPDPYLIAKPGPITEDELNKAIIARLYKVLR